MNSADRDQLLKKIQELSSTYYVQLAIKICEVKSWEVPSIVAGNTTNQIAENLIL